MRGGDAAARHHASPSVGSNAWASVRGPSARPQAVPFECVFVKQLLLLASGVVGQLSSVALRE